MVETKREEGKRWERHKGNRSGKRMNETKNN